jgi:hypothetical protein
LVKQGKKSPYEKLFKKLPEWLKYLRRFVELAVVHNNKDIQIKLANRGNICIYVCHPANHANKVCQFLSLKTLQLVSSRPYKFKNMMVDKYLSLQKSEVSKVKFTDDDEEEGFEFTAIDLENMVDLNEEEEQEELSEDEEINDDYNEEDEQEFWKTVKAPPMELRKLQMFYNPNPFHFVNKDDDETAEIAMLHHILGHYEVALQSPIYDGNPEPTNLEEEKPSKEWLHSTEIENMHSKSVWEIAPKTSVPEN